MSNNSQDKGQGRKSIEEELEEELDEAAGEVTSSAGEEDPGSATEDFVLEHLKKKQKK